MKIQGRKVKGRIVWVRKISIGKVYGRMSAEKSKQNSLWKKSSRKESPRKQSISLVIVYGRRPSGRKVYPQEESAEEILKKKLRKH